LSILSEMNNSDHKTEGMDISRIREELKNSVFGNRIVYHEVTDSTNTRAKELAGAGVPHGTVIVTEEQLAGKGRLDRKWVSPRARNLMFSMVLRPDVKVDQVFFLTMLLALSVRDALKDVLDVVALIKWPNDIYVSGKKTGGILAEFSVCENQVEHVIIGLGLNVNWYPKKEPTVLYPCTSLMRETGFPVERSSLLVEILLRFEKNYQAGILEKGTWNVFQKQWNACSYVLGKHVVVRNGMENIAGKAVEIDGAGALIIRDNLGKESRILWGDVSVETIQAP
jgi:BirA family transcriptional regulator, biotin operon repressor / biotin---[acetyl-CoA-carboxylase] ligase